MSKEDWVRLWLHVPWGVISNAGTAGNLQLQWAQDTAEVSDTRVITDSYILAHRLA